MQLHRKDLVASLVFLAIAFIVTYAVVQKDKYQAEIQQQTIHQNLVKLSTTQREVQGLKSVVKRQQNVILAARGVGLLSLSPGPWMDYRATFYDASKGINGEGDGITYSGKQVAQEWTVASDNSILPIGSVIEVKFQNGNTQIYQVLDRGGAIKGQHIDIYEPSLADCYKMGVQNVEVRVLMRGEGR